MPPQQSMPSNQSSNQQQFHMPQQRYPQQQGMMGSSQNGNQGNQMIAVQQPMGAYRQSAQPGERCVYILCTYVMVLHTRVLLPVNDRWIYSAPMHINIKIHQTQHSV